MSPAARARALMAELDVEFNDWGGRTQLLGMAYSPPGKAFAATGCHSIATGFHNDRPAGWQALTDDLSKGLVDCDDPDCEICNPPEVAP